MSVEDTQRSSDAVLCQEAQGTDHHALLALGPQYLVCEDSGFWRASVCGTPMSVLKERPRSCGHPRMILYILPSRLLILLSMRCMRCCVEGGVLFFVCFPSVGLHVLVIGVRPVLGVMCDVSRRCSWR